MAETLHRGHCLCGNVKFESTVGPKWIAYCHCASCRRHTASAAATFVGFDERYFRHAAGQPTIFESSPNVWRSFCGRCGSPISYTATRFPGEVHIYVGVMNYPELYVPTAHAYFAEHLPWFDTKDDFIRLPRTSQD